MEYCLAIRARLSCVAAAWLGAVLALALFCAGPVWADIHPVPLEKNADSAKCLECHADKAKGKSVHTAISTGCTSCHEIRVSRDVTRVKLITTTPYALCLTCHADKNAADIKGIVHKPRRARLSKVSRSTRIRKQVPTAEADFGQSERKPLLELPHHGTECFREGKPACGARYGLRDVPRNA